MQERDLRNHSRHPFGPRQPGLWGWLKRACQWGLLLTVAACLFPAVMAAITVVTAFIPLGDGWRVPSGSEMAVLGTWGLWLVQLVLTALRLSEKWYRPWAMGLTGLALGALLYAIGTPPDPEGRAIQLLMALVAAVLLLLHALWSLSERLLQSGKPTVLRLLTALAAFLSGLLLAGFGMALLWLLLGGLVEGPAEAIQLALACLQWAAWLGLTVLTARVAGRRSHPPRLWLALCIAELAATAASLLMAGTAARDELLLILIPLMTSALLTALGWALQKGETRHDGV